MFNMKTCFFVIININIMLCIVSDEGRKTLLKEKRKRNQEKCTDVN